MGAWIETLKQSSIYGFKTSHPVWVRGLKQKEFLMEVCLMYVAPCMGAWIETSNVSSI